MARLFGTDGVRGLANADLTPELAMALAVAGAHVLGNNHRPVAVVGRDPRASGEMLEAAVVAGLTAAGADVLRVGVLPTPAVAYLVGELSADFGVMISASHNPMPDNGIKFFAEGGQKLSDELEDLIETQLQDPGKRPTGALIGRVTDVTDAVQRYVDHLLVATPVGLSGVRVVVDCAHGAASVAAPEAFRRAGADVVSINAEPDGNNINDNCGSTHMTGLIAAVRKLNADLGIALDGDADRCLAVDGDGNFVDGDQILAVLAIAMKESGELKDDTLVATVMSNLGLHIAMRKHGVKLRTTAVGDRYVLEELRASSFSLGGEQSGHVVLPSHATTGDGILTALRLMGRVVATGKSLADLAGVVHRLPQVLINVPVSDKATVANSEAVASAVAEVEAQLGDTGRVLLRPSGTEQLVRVMVEALTEDLATEIGQRLARIVAAV